MRSPGVGRPQDPGETEKGDGPGAKAGGDHGRESSGENGRGSGPILGRAVLRVLLPRDRGDDLVGDLGELYTNRRRTRPFRARLWYWRQVFEIGGRIAWEGRANRVALPRRRRATGGHGLFATSDVKLAGRMLAKTPVLTAIAVLAMAVGIGLATCAYSVIDAVFFARLPFPNAERIVRLENYYVPGGFPIRTDADVFDLRRRTMVSFDHVVGYETRRVSIEAAERGEADVVRLAYITPNVFDMLEVQPWMGRGFRADDVAPDSAAVTAISHSLWRGRFGADPSVVGRQVRLDGQLRTIVGVMPQGFVFPNDQQAWIPIDTNPVRPSAGMPLWTVARLAADIDIVAAEAEWRAVATRRPARDGYDVEDLSHRVVEFTRPANDTEPVVLAATAFVLLVLLVTAANVANLLLARTSARQGEMAVRAALGASRGRIVGQLFLEALVIGTIAAVLGVAASRPVLSWLSVNGDLPWWTEFRLDPGVFVFVAGATVFASAVAGIPPALRATSKGLEGVLRDEGTGTLGLSFSRSSTALLVAQVTLSIGFLSTATLVAQGLYQQGLQDFGVPEAEVVVAQIYWGQPSERDRRASAAETWEAFVLRADASRRRIEERLRGMPDIASASSATGVPGQDWIGWNSRRAIEVDDAFPGEGERTANVVEISKGYFATYDINLLAGRAFDDADHAGGTLVAIVNEPFVHKHLGPGGAIGRKVRWGTASEGGSIEWRPWLEIVGVIPDIGVDPADPGSADAIYEPLSPSNIVLMSVRTRGELPALTSALYEVVAGEETGAEVQSLYTLEELVAGPAGPLRTVGLGAVVVGAITLLLSACGLYAIMSFTVTRRTREIGIRLALGAGASRVIGSILLQAAVPLGAGALLGIALGSTSALVLAWLLPLDPLRAGAGVLVVVSGLMIAVGVVACLAPARRALSVRPVEALRNS